jgi:hypothetical protein
MIAEILSRSGACKEVPHRKMSQNLLWDELPNLTTVLKPGNECDDVSAGERRTDEEMAVSTITDELFDSDGVALPTNAEAEANAKLDPAVLVALTGVAPPAHDLEENEEEEEEESIESEGVEVEIVVGSRRFGKVTKMKVNPLCLRDVSALGRQKMVTSNVTALRYRRKQRTRRERKFLQESLHNTLNGTTVSHTRDLVARLLSGERTEQPNFRRRYLL